MWTAGTGHTPEFPKQPNGAEGAHRADHAHRQDGGARQGQDGEDDHGGVHDVVAVPKEGGQPVGIQVDDELGDEEAREAEVEVVEGCCDGGLGAVRADQLRAELGLGYVDRKVLLRKKSVRDFKA